MIICLALVAAACATAPKPLPKASGSYAISVGGFAVQKAPYYDSQPIAHSLYTDAVRGALREAFGAPQQPADGSITVYVFENVTNAQLDAYEPQPPRIEYTVERADGRKIKGAKYGGDRRTPEDARQLAEDLTREIERRLR